MGKSNTSSKRKSSSSLNKKRYKNPSQERKRKRSRRNKLKKLRRPDVSISDDYEDSKSLVSITSSSSSEDDYRRKRSRSHNRRDVRSSKKRARRNSSSSERSPDAPHLKKKKGSKRKANLDTRKKTHRKKSKRDVSSSVSCPTCAGSSSSSGGESEDKKRRGRHERKERGKRDLGKSQTKRSGYRSQSSSSCSWGSKSSGHLSGEQLVRENHPRRLRSVITVVRQPEEMEEREFVKDGHKEEIIYDHDDYPSCKSNDSNDGESKRDLTHHSQVVTSQNKEAENVQVEEAFVSKIRTTEVMGSDNDDQDRYDGSNPSLELDLVEANNSSRENKSGDSAAVGSPNNEDLESILRQRALENLKKFRGELQMTRAADQKEKNDSKQSFTANTEPSQIKSIRGATRVADRISVPTKMKSSTHVSQNDKNVRAGEYSKTRSEATEVVQNKTYREGSSRLVSRNPVVDSLSVPKAERNPNLPLESEQKIQDGYNGRSVSTAAGKEVNCVSNQLVETSKEKENVIVDASNNNSRLGMLGFRRDSSGNRSSPKQVLTSWAFPEDKHLASKSDVDTSAAETEHNSSNSNGEQGSTSRDPSTYLKPALGEHSSKDMQEAKEEGSQFKQKTMSVMRGGEAVQVSYKVYIPKKAPALARRQLKR